jgi:hypothetical protein
MEEDRFELSSTYIANITDYQLSNSPFEIHSFNKIIDKLLILYVL